MDWTNYCSAESTTTGDWDGDLVSDVAVLYNSYILFYYSSKRSKGALPLRGDAGSGGMRLDLGLKKFRSIRSLDLDNDGVDEVVVFEKSGQHRIYRNGGNYSWVQSSDLSTFGNSHTVSDADRMFACKELEKLRAQILRPDNVTDCRSWCSRVNKPWRQKCGWRGLSCAECEWCKEAGRGK